MSESGTPERDDETPEPDHENVRRRGRRRAVRRGTEREAVPGVSADERAAGWGDGSTAGGDDSNDARLLRDVPPHW
ncbi:hypothetical protein [Myceligenerans crystallogenes]|uniref:Uncharacterized protein n=1 Tax=Myceligenerans crystallogenes TaxID=316335 RepID=A0ABN2NBQ0_9MICO